MNRDISQESKNYEDLLNGNCGDLEGIIQKEPQKNKYETVGYHKMNQLLFNRNSSIKIWNWWNK